MLFPLGCAEIPSSYPLLPALADSLETLFGNLRESSENRKGIWVGTAQQASVLVKGRPGSWQRAGTHRGTLSAKTLLLKNKTAC